MTRTHVPVLAGELIDLLDPHPGETAIDCTFGDGGHARLVADRLGPSGTLICIDRDPAAEERFENFAREVPCDTRFIRMDNASALELLWDEHVQADIAYLDLGVSSMQIDTWERGFSYSYDAPLDMRMDSEQEFDAREIVNDVGRPPSCAALPALRRGAVRAPDRPRDRAPPRPRARSRRRTSSWRPSRRPSPRPRCSAAAIRPSACSRRSESP